MSESIEDKLLEKYGVLEHLHLTIAEQNFRDAYIWVDYVEFWERTQLTNTRRVISYYQNISKEFKKI